MRRDDLGVDIDPAFIENYYKALVGHFFKILPMKESNEASLPTYLESLQIEMLGCQRLIAAVSPNPLYMSLLGILQYLIDNPSCGSKTVKREVFKAISICNKLSTTGKS